MAFYTVISMGTDIYSGNEAAKALDVYIRKGEKDAFISVWYEGRKIDTVRDYRRFKRTYVDSLFYRELQEARPARAHRISTMLIGKHAKIERV